MRIVLEHSGACEWQSERAGERASALYFQVVQRMFCSFLHSCFRSLSGSFPMVEFEHLRDSLMKKLPPTSSIFEQRKYRKWSSPGKAPRIVPDDVDDDPIVHTAIIGKADILCTLNSHFFHPSLVDYCLERDVIIARDVEVLDLLRGRRRAGEKQ